MCHKSECMNVPYFQSDTMHQQELYYSVSDRNTYDALLFLCQIIALERTQVKRSEYHFKFE